MSDIVFSDPDLEAAYKAAKKIKEQEMQMTALWTIGLLAAEHDFLKEAREIRTALGSSAYRFPLALTLYEASGDQDDLLAAKDALAFVHDAREYQFATHDATRRLLAAMAYHDKDLETCRKHLGSIRGVVQYANAQSDLYDRTRDPMDLVPLMELRARLGQNRDPSLDQTIVDNITDRAMGLEVNMTTQRVARLKRLIEMHAPKPLLMKELELILRGGALETAESYFAQLHFTKDDPRFRAAYACGHAVRHDLNTARELAKGLQDPYELHLAFVEIFKASHKAN